MAKTKSTASKKDAAKIDISWVWGPSRVYIVEYFMYLLSLFVVLVSGIQLFNRILDSATDVPSVSNVLSELGFLNDSTLMLVSIALVFTVTYGLLYTRLRKAEREVPALKQSRKRRILQYIYLTIVAIMLLVVAVEFVYLILNWLVNQSNSGVIWQDVVKLIFAGGFLKLGAYTVLRQTPYVTGGKK